MLLSGAVEISVGLGLDTHRTRLVRLYVEPLMWAVALYAGLDVRCTDGGRNPSIT